MYILMLLKMSAVTLFYILLTFFLWKRYENREKTWVDLVLISGIYGMCSIISTHFAINYGHMLLNVRDLGPLMAGLFFHPVCGLVSGLIGGIERYIAGTYMNVGSYTCIACSLSTCLAGVYSYFINKKFFKGKVPHVTYALFIGAVMEVFHMYVVIITHRGDMDMAYYVVKNCAGPMIVFTALGLGLTSFGISYIYQKKPIVWGVKGEKVTLAKRFQFWLFLVSFVTFFCSTFFIYVVQTQSAFQHARNKLISHAEAVGRMVARLQGANIPLADYYIYYVYDENVFEVINSGGKIVIGNHRGNAMNDKDFRMVKKNLGKPSFRAELFRGSYLCHAERLDDGLILLTLMKNDEIYAERDAQVLESILASILLFSVIYTLTSYLVQIIVVEDLNLINRSLNKITHGDLDEEVLVRNSAEFASLSDDINQTVGALKGYIKEAETRMEKELLFAWTIQDAALPKNFNFQRKDFELYAIIDPAKEVGGDFYDFFFVGKDLLTLVIADVSGKGIPAALFMMRAKTTIRNLAETGSSPAEIFYKANNTLCEGNDAEMFVTAWIGIVDLKTGHMRCANAGHEYPAIMRADGEYELYKDKHTMPLATMPGIRGKEYELQFQPGDRIFVYTDGVPEPINNVDEEYGTDRMLEVLNKEKEDTLADRMGAIRQDINEFTGDVDQFDDITMMEFIYHGKEITT